MGVKGKIMFLQEGDLKIHLPFCLQMQRNSNSQLFPLLRVGNKEGENHNVGDSVHRGSGAPSGIKSCLNPT